MKNCRYNDYFQKGNGRICFDSVQFSFKVPLEMWCQVISPALKCSSYNFRNIMGPLKLQSNILTQLPTLGCLYWRINKITVEINLLSLICHLFKYFSFIPWIMIFFEQHMYYMSIFHGTFLFNNSYCIKVEVKLIRNYYLIS